MTAGRFSSFFVGRSGHSLIVLVALLCAGLAVCAANFPVLTGRVVDEANVLSTATRDALSSKLAELETKSGIQLVVATVNSLQGDEIEPYANELFRAWKLGEKAKNNGVLLLIAPTERRARIEVGYGLEGTLTDALTRVIIENAIIPRFRANDFRGGIARGVDDLIQVLSGDTEAFKQQVAAKEALRKQPSSGDHALLFALFWIGLMVFIIFVFFRAPRRGRGGPWIVPFPVGSSSGSSWS